MLEAVFDVFTDEILDQLGSADKALLWVMLQDHLSEFCVSIINHPMQFGMHNMYTFTCY